MSINIFKKIFKKEEEEHYTFNNYYEENYIKLEIFKNNKKCLLNSFEEKEYEYLLKTEIFDIDEENNMLNLSYENIYSLDEDCINFFQLPTFFNGTLKIENDTYFLNKKGVRFNINFIDGQNKYSHITKNLIIRRNDGKKFFLRQNDYHLVQDILKYNDDINRITIPLEQYKMVNKIKKLKEKKEIILDNDIEKIGEIQIIDSLKLDFVEKDRDNLEILPILENIDEMSEKEKIIEKFQKIFKDHNVLQKKYTLSIDGKEHEIILSDELLKVLEVVKENKNIIETKAFLKKEGPIFSDLRMETAQLDYNYGPRVKGLGFLNYRPTSCLNNSDIDWFSSSIPYIDTSDGEQIKLHPTDIPYLEERLRILDSEKKDEIILSFDTQDGKRNLLIEKNNLQNEILKIKNSCKEVVDFKKSKDLKNIFDLIEKEENIDKEYIEYKNFYVKNINDKDSIKELIKQAEFRELEKKKKEVLLLKDNINELEHNEQIKEIKFERKYIQPKSLKKNVTLLPYQREGIQKMQNLYLNNPINGILLSDDMGLGKTLQILTFIAWLKESNNKIKIIIVVPTSLITNWYNDTTEEKNQGEIQKFFEKDTFVVEILKGKLSKDKLNEILNTNILILSYETLRINHIELGKIRWDVMVCDEAQKIKNPSTLLTTAVKSQNVGFKIACSATPIENTILDLWCLVDFCCPGLLGSLKDFKKNYNIKTNDEKFLKSLNDKLKIKLGDHFIRRTKDILNIQGKEFPKKIISYFHLRYSEKQRDILNYFNHMKLLENSALAIIQGMIMACSHPKLIEKTTEVKENTSILLEESYKLESVKKILDIVKAKDEKAIIFTKYRKMQRILSIVLKEWYGFIPIIINGDNSSELRRKLLDNYRQMPGFNVIILSPEAAGVGLNIIEANHVIHYTRHWNPAKEEQATDRTYRIGQKKDVFVYYPLVAENENIGNLTFNNIDDWIESDKFNFSKESSPEEKLNKIIIKKKKMLRDFFLAAPIDLEVADFKEFENINSKSSQESQLNLEQLDILGWEFLEAAIVVLLEKQYNGRGYLTKKSYDFGVDGLIEMPDNKFIAIQVKKSKNIVGSKALEEVLSGKKIYENELKIKIQKIVVATNSSVTSSLHKWENENIEIIDRKKLQILLDRYSLTLNMLEEKIKIRD